ncbi:3-oxoacyl-ACP synthase III family protein [Mesonia sp. K7]|uniref:3-oxoacyl-ACP synthase III family protein n=1 Tax=Mesonia sp. K7 TaxID=2218606 RepID=UPI000DA774BE|nr:ketoacyl-ACP synthase III [Mesonia sp. K7]PZD76495.1 ketoacyl-ACP synthase III [Mesonia sp. K7]
MAEIITGIGSYIPERKIINSYFLEHQFLNEDGSAIKDTNSSIIQKFQAITGIDERLYAKENFTASNMASIAAKRAIDNAQIDPETLDYIIVAHNFGDIKEKNSQSDTVPSLATRVKYELQIKNPNCVAYDLIFGCPGWLEGMIHASAFIKARMAKRILVVGTETLSRVVDDHDRDSMIFSDGAGATIIEYSDKTDKGIIAHKSATYASAEANYLTFEESYNKVQMQATKYIKMNGRKIYNFALTKVPQAMKTCLEESGYKIQDVKKLLIHQANEKMDQAICDRFYQLFDMPVPEHIMPMSIQKLGNSSVATLPTLLDLVMKKQLENQSIEKGDVVIFASVGAGMNINAMVYKF